MSWLVCLKNGACKESNALVLHNNPFWKKSACEWQEGQRCKVSEGLIETRGHRVGRRSIH